MRVSVSLHLGFRTGRFDEAVLDVPPGTTVEQLVFSLRLPREELGLVVVNDRQANVDQQLATGDQVALFPFICGG